MRLPRVIPIFRRNNYEDEEPDIIAMRESAKRGRQRCGMLLATCFVIAVAAAASSVWSTQWKDREFDSLVPPPAPLQPIPSPPASSGTTPPAPTPEGLPNVGCNGLTDLCTTPLNEIVFATAHNAAATADVQIVAPNHDRSMLEALRFGYRGLNMDLGLCNGELKLVHTTCALGTDDPAARFQEIADFITNERPNDVLMITLELNQESGGPFSVDFVAGWIESRVPDFAQLLFRGNGLGNGVWPTPNAMRAAGRAIALFHYGAEGCGADCPVGYLQWFQYAVETPFSFDTTTELFQNPTTSCAITRGGQGTGDLYGVNVFTRIPSSYTCQELNSPDRLQAHLQACAQETGRRVTMVLVDCWDQGDVLSVVQQLNSGTV